MISFRHARHIRAIVNVIFAETWLTRDYGPETPLLTELMDLLTASGFVLAEIGNRFYGARHALYGCDAFLFEERVPGSCSRFHAKRSLVRCGCRCRYSPTAIIATVYKTWLDFCDWPPRPTICRESRPPEK